MTPRPIRVLIIDDSALVRGLLSNALKGASDIEVVGTAPDPVAAQEQIASTNPDVITLDLEMPRMDGISFLKSLPVTRSAAVIVVSSLGKAGCSAALQALEAGAVEVVAKPGGRFSVGDLRSVLPEKIRAAHRARRMVRATMPLAPSAAATSAKSALHTGPNFPVIAIGASTGGTEALHALLPELPAASPPILIVQHIPPVFSKAFADRLNACCRIRVSEAVDGQRLEPGVALVAPGDQHMIVRRIGGAYRVQIQSGPRVCYQRPSVDVLFQSVAESIGANVIGIILTGMGSDGARGLLRMREAGAHTIGQDETSCVIYGMPREAARVGAVQQVAPLTSIASCIITASGL